jgi:hypothetical protein
MLMAPVHVHVHVNGKPVHVYGKSDKVSQAKPSQGSQCMFMESKVGQAREAGPCEKKSGTFI